MKKLYIFLSSFILLIPHSFSQCQDVDFSSACLDYLQSQDQGGLCHSFKSPCNANWGRSHGSPDMAQYVILSKNGNINSFYVEMWSGGSGSTQIGEGIFYSYSFVQGIPVTITIHSATDLANGSLNGRIAIYAVTGLVQPAMFNCGNALPHVPTQQLIGYITSLNPDVGTEYSFNFVPNAAYNQFWIYPESLSTVGQFDMGLSDVQFCPGCSATLTYTSSSVIPAGILTGSVINAGSILGPGRPEAVINQPTTLTELSATNEVNLLPNFSATVSGNGIFSAIIHDCSYIPPISNTAINYDSVHYIPGTLPQEFSSTSLLSIGKSTIENSNSASTEEIYDKLSIFPTITAGTVNITGRKIDLVNSEIIVVDELGRVAFKETNGLNTSLTLNLSNLKNGLYFIQIKNSIKSETKKFIISK